MIRVKNAVVSAAQRAIKALVGDHMHLGKANLMYEKRNRDVVQVMERGRYYYVCWDDEEKGRVIPAVKFFVRHKILDDAEKEEVRKQIEVYKKFS